MKRTLASRNHEEDKLLQRNLELEQDLSNLRKESTPLTDEEDSYTVQSLCGLLGLRREELVESIMEREQVVK